MFGFASFAETPFASLVGTAYIVSQIDTQTLTDLNVPLLQFNSTCTELITLVDYQSPHGWIKINDNQTVTWNYINNNQNSVWNPIPAQSASALQWVNNSLELVAWSNSNGSFVYWSSLYGPPLIWQQINNYQ